MVVVVCAVTRPRFCCSVAALPIPTPTIESTVRLRRPVPPTARQFGSSTPVRSLSPHVYSSWDWYSQFSVLLGPFMCLNVCVMFVCVMFVCVGMCLCCVLCMCMRMLTVCDACVFRLLVHPLLWQ